MEMKKMTLEQFCAETASNQPAPGGGSVSALAGALAASLAEMVAQLTVGKKGYEDAEAEMAGCCPRPLRCGRSCLMTSPGTASPLTVIWTH